MDSERWQRVARIHEDALARAPAERTAFVAQAAGGDGALRAEVESLLAMHDRPSLLDRGLDAAAADLLEERHRLTPGARLGAYRIEGLLGAGGMGDVYRAHDERLGRRVALKVLPDAWAADRDRLVRFEREARVLASLSHPNIAAIHGIEDGGGTPALVLELVEGPTLAERIARGPLPVDEALAIARQMAGALEAAHEAGIVHRDLKPANIKVTPAGTVKVLDFGIARLTHASDAVDPEGSGSTPNPTAVATGVGLILGTAAYMAPEQAKGQPADKRSDIWAFACIVYEMLSGRRAFGGESAADTLANVVRGDPDWQALPDIPPPLARMLHRSLQKDRRQRLADAADARLDIEEAVAALNAPPVQHVPRGSRRLLVPLMTGAVALAIAVVTLVPPAARPQQAIRFHVHAPEGTQFTGQPHQSISPDGQHLAFVAVDGDGVDSLWVRPLDSVDARRLPGTEGATLPFWSPTSDFLGFFADGKLRTIALAGGVPRPIADAPNGAGGAWNRDGTIVFAPTQRGGLVQVAVGGGALSPLTMLTGDELSHRNPFFLPDGRRFLFLSSPATIFLGSLDSSERVPVATADSNAIFAEPGYLLYLSAGALVARPFDAGRATVTGDEQRIADGVRATPAGLAPFSVSESGILTYRPAMTRLTRLTWFDRRGTPLSTVGEPDAYTTVRLSPSGAYAALQRLDSSLGTHDIWTVDLARGVPTPLTLEPTNETSPAWSPDERQIAYTVTDGDSGMYRRSREGGQPLLLAQTVITGPLVEDWSGDSLIFHSPGTRRGIWVLPLVDGQSPSRFLETSSAVDEMQLSPNRRWMTYASDEPGRFEVHVRAFPGGGHAQRVTATGASQPQWRADGRELFYLQLDGALMSVDFDPESGAIGIPRRLFMTGLPVRAVQEQYSVTGDGQRFLVLMPADTASDAAPLIVITNWVTSLIR